MDYHHKQLGFVLISVFVIVFLFLVDLLVLSIIFWHDQVPAFANVLLIIATLAVVVLAVLFSSMTIAINDGELIWHFSLGFWKNRIPLHHIAACAPVQNKWWYGWGIHRVAGGWLYNVSGFEAAELRLTDGRLIRLGSDEVGKLIAAIDSARG